MAKRVSRARYLVLGSCWLSCESTEQSELSVKKCRNKKEKCNEQERESASGKKTATHEGQGDSRGQEEERNANIDPPSTRFLFPAAAHKLRSLTAQYTHYSTPPGLVILGNCRRPEPRTPDSSCQRAGTGRERTRPSHRLQIARRAAGVREKK